MHLNKLAKILRTAGDDNRLRILCVLFGHKKISVSDIAQKLKLSVAIVSHHLKAMEKEGLLIAKNEGKCAFYQLPNEKVVNDLKKFICKYKD